MASSTKFDVEYEMDQEDGGMDTLDFQDIPHSDTDKGKTHEFTNFPHSAVDSDDDGEEDTSKLLQDEEKAAPASSSFWTFNYYQEFFNVDTKQVGMRIVGSMLPKPGSNYLVKEIRPNPDLYGPFWICTTLVFTTAIAGNLANYFSSAGDYHWRYDFHKVTLAATAIFGYWWLIPLLLFGVIWWQGFRDRFSFLEMICVYGYSLAIYIPISVLWAIQVAWLQWTLVVLGTVLSGSVLLMTFWPVVSEGNKKIAIGVMVFIFVMHAALAAGFVLYFFYVPATPVNHPSTAVPIATTKPLPTKLSSKQNVEAINKAVNTPVGPANTDTNPVKTLNKGKTQNTLIRKLMPKGLQQNDGDIFGDKENVNPPLKGDSNAAGNNPPPQRIKKERSSPLNSNNDNNLAGSKQQQNTKDDNSPVQQLNQQSPRQNSNIAGNLVQQQNLKQLR